MTITIENTPVTSAKTKTKVTTLNLVLDPGTSCTKVIYSKGRKGKPQYLVESSVVCPINFTPSPHQTYIKLPDREQHYLVGSSAASSKHSVSIKQLKSESLIVKVLGTIGQIAKSEALSKVFNLNLRLLLPVSEIDDTDFIETKLSSALNSFNYSGNDYQVNLQSSYIYSEGSGISHYLSKQSDTDELQYQTSVYLMFGYRNTSLLLFEKGQINLERSLATDLGFYNYLDLVTKHGSGLYRDEIQQAIATKPVYGVVNCREVIKGYTSEIVVEDLVRSSNPEFQAKERASISAAIGMADKEYWQLLSTWLREKLPALSKLDRVTYCGGSTSFIETPLKEFFEDWQGELYNSHEMSLTMLEKLKLSSIAQKKFIQQYLPIRLADAWGIYVKLMNLKL